MKTLSKRQQEVMAHMVLGKTNSEIAKALGVTRETINTHIQAAYKKLGVKRRIQAVKLFTELGTKDSMVKNKQPVIVLVQQIRQNLVKIMDELQ